MFAYLVCMVLLIAALGQFAATRSPIVHNSPILRAASKLTGVGLLVMGVYLAYFEHEFGAAPAPVLLAGFIFALGQVLYGMNTLFTSDQLKKFGATLERKAHEITHT